jgi:SAM-dependent methyltransferase
LFGPAPAEDAAVFQNALEQVTATTPSTESIIVLDLGTGTGRVLQDLVDTIDVRTDAPRFKLIGIDHSKPMLDRANAKFAEQRRTHGIRVMEPQWLLGSAADFFRGALQSAQQIDMLIFAAGGISHLTADGETKSFLQQVKIALRENDTSIAIISVLHEFIEHGQLTQEMQRPVETSDEPEEVRIPSRDHHGLIYIKSPTAVARSGSSRIDRFSVKAIKGQTNCEMGHPTTVPTVIWETEMAWSLKNFNEDFWKEEVSSVGLQIVSVKEGSIQRWYFIKHAAV